MSYDLSFWKYSDGVSLNHHEIYLALSNGDEIEGIQSIDSEAIRQTVESEFLRIGWSRLGPNDFESDAGSFQLYHTEQLFRVDCYGMSGDDMNRLIDIAVGFGCRLYDPQVGERYGKG